MANESPVAVISRLSAQSLGVFRGKDAVARKVTRDQLLGLCSSGVIERVFPDTYRMTAVAPTTEQSLRAALLWAGDIAGGAGLSAGEQYGLEGVRAPQPEIVVLGRSRRRASGVTVHRSLDRAALMIREHRGLRVTGIEATLVSLAAKLDGEAFEIACEDARRRRLTSVPALHAYLDRFGRRGRPGVGEMRALLKELDPVHASRSTLEIKTRRLLVAHGITDFVREFRLDWNGRPYYFDFGFGTRRTIFETNGRRWHDDATDYEDDNEKWTGIASCSRPGTRSRRHPTN